MKKTLALTAAISTTAAALVSAGTTPLSVNYAPPVTQNVQTATASDFVKGLNPRTEFNDIPELAASIYQNGQLSPLIVRAMNGKLQLAAGERRWRAFKLLIEGFWFEIAPATEEREAVKVWMQIPADYPILYVQRELSDNQMIDLAIQENKHAPLTVLEKVDVVMLWHSHGMGKEEMALKASLSVDTIAQYLTLGFGLTKDGKKLYSEGKINFRKAVILSQTQGALKQTLIRAFKDNDSGLSEKDMLAMVKNIGFDPDNAVFDVKASGLEFEERLYPEMPLRFRDQRTALAYQVDTLNSRADEYRAQNPESWAEVVAVETENGVLPRAFTHHGETGRGKVWTYNTTTGKVNEFDNVCRVREETALKKMKGKGSAPAQQSAATTTPAPQDAPPSGMSKRDAERADREAQAQLLAEALMNNPKAAQVHTIIRLMESPLYDRTIPAVQKFAKHTSEDKPELFRLLSPGVLALKVTKKEAVGVLMGWSAAALAELLAYLTSAPCKDAEYADAIIAAAE